MKFEIVILKDIDHPSVEKFAIKIQCLNTDPIVIVNIYRHPVQNTCISFFDLLNELQHHKNCIFQGFLTSHTTPLGDPKINLYQEENSNHRRLLLNIAQRKHPLFCDLFQLQLQFQTLVLASPHLALLCETNVESDTLGSDHFPVMTKNWYPGQSKFCYKLLLTKEMCQVFHHELLSSIKNLSAEVGQDIIDSYDRFT